MAFAPPFQRPFSPILDRRAAAAANGVSLAEVIRYIQQMTERASAVKSITSVASADLFTVAGGPVRVLSIVGQVTTVIQTQANNCKLTHTPTGGTAVDLCATADVTGVAVRKVLALNGVKATALQVSTDIGVVVLANQNGMPIVLTPGVIALSGSATSTGAISWYIEYEPVVPGATIVPA